MSYQIEPGEALAEGLRRVAREEVDGILESLRSLPERPGEAVHDARERLKKVRAVLRLVRRHVGEEVFQRENATYRDAGRLLSGAREADVASETLDRLREHHDAVLADGAFESLRERLERRGRQALDRVIAESGPAARARECVERARERIPDWPLDGLELEGVAPGLREVYECGSRRMAEAYEIGGAALFHEWRKRVKYLWYHVRLLAPSRPEVLTPLAEAQHELSDLLGDANDLSELLELLEREDVTDRAGDEAAEALRALAVGRREALWARARPLGARLYAEEPDEFAGRMAGYWRGMRLERRVGAGAASPRGADPDGVC